MGGAKKKLDRALHDHMIERSSAKMHRILLWTALGNGAGLAAAGGKLIENLDKPIAALLVPSCWIFVAGLLLSGLSAAIEAKRFQELIKSFEFVSLDHIEAVETRKMRVLEVVQEVTEPSAGILFACGVIYPLFVVSVRYIATGSFTG